MLHGVLVVNKPPAMTSHDVVDRIRRVTKMRRIGHTGTLDPMATGVLPLCLGKATRIAEFLQAEDKVYEVEMLLGITTDSQDTTGQVVETRTTNDLEEAKIKEVFGQFFGPQEQIPPMVSARHHQGRRLYELARQGIEVPREPKKINIWNLEILLMEMPRIRFRVHCSKGTYVRTLCHDLGQKMGPGAAMSELMRLKCGRFLIQDAVPLDQLGSREIVENYLRDMDEALSQYPQVFLKEEAVRPVLQGAQIVERCIEKRQGEFQAEEWVRVSDPNGKLLAMAEARVGSKGLGNLEVKEPAFHPVKLLADCQASLSTVGYKL